MLAAYMSAIMSIPLLALYAVLELKSTPTYMLTMSFFERAIAPFLMVASVMRSHFFWGIGLGDTDALTALAAESIRGLWNIGTNAAGGIGESRNIDLQRILGVLDILRSCWRRDNVMDDCSLVSHIARSSLVRRNFLHCGRNVLAGIW